MTIISKVFFFESIYFSNSISKRNSELNGSKTTKEEYTFGQRYVLFCSLGWRSALATSALKDLGFSNVAHLEQGFTGWVDSDQTVEKVTSGEKWFKNQSDIKSSLEITKE